MIRQSPNIGRVGEVLGRVDHTAICDAHYLLRVIDTRLPTVAIDEMLPAACNIGEGKVMKEDQSIIGSMHFGCFCIVQRPVTIVISIDEYQRPLDRSQTGIHNSILEGRLANELLHSSGRIAGDEIHILLDASAPQCIDDRKQYARVLG